MDQWLVRGTNVAAAHFAIILIIAAPHALAEPGGVYFGEVAPATADVSVSAGTSTDRHDDCPGGESGPYGMAGNLDCGAGSDARRMPAGSEFGNWRSSGKGANTALGRRALASGPAWSARRPVRIQWNHETDAQGRTGAVWADGAHEACVRQLSSSPVNHPDPERSCAEVQDGTHVRDAQGRRILVAREDASTLNARVAERMEELGLMTDRVAHYFDKDGNPTSSPSDLSWNTAVGADADARGYRSSNVALGHGAQAWGHGERGNGASNIAIGRRANASGSFSNNIAIGTGAEATGEDTGNIAIGRGASATGDAVAIGNGVKASDNEVRIGNPNQRVVIGGFDLSEVWRGGGSSPPGADGAALRQLTADVTANSSAILANAEGIAANADAIAANSEAIQAISPLVEEVGLLDERVSRANATAAALSAVPNSPLEKTFLVGFGLGSHQSETALAVGASGRVGKDGGVMFNGGMANSGDGTTVRVGVGLVW